MKDSLKRLLKYITERYSFFFSVTIICVVVSALSSVAAYAYLSLLVDRYITPLIDMEDKASGFAALLKALIVLIFIFLSGVFAQLIQARSVARMTHGTMYDLRKDIFDRMEHFPAKYFDTHSKGEIMSVYTNDTDAIRQMISQGIPNIISALITVVAILAALLYLNIPLALLSVLMVGLVMGVSMKIVGSARSSYSEQQENLASLNGYVEEIFSGQKVVKVFHREDKCLEEFREKNEALRKSAFKASKYTGIVSAVNMQAGNIVFYFLFALLCSIFVINGWGNMTIGKTIAFLSLSKTMNVPVVLASGQIYSCVTALAGAKRIFGMIDEECEEDSGKKAILPGDVRGRVELQNVNFSYVPGTQILYDINITAESGQKIAIVGSTGSGKTTITNLLNRFYDLDSGRILLDGTDIREYRKEDLRRLIGIVLQDTHLFTGSILDNIRYGNPLLTDRECMEAAEKARADDFILRLPDGYDTVLCRDAENLAEGQRQLLNIARAVAANAPILILDEATSSVDPGTEKLIQEGMDNLMKGRTSFVIAHRLSTIKNSNLIIVLDHGRILESGSHEELMSKKGAYYSLYSI